METLIRPPSLAEYPVSMSRAASVPVSVVTAVRNGASTLARTIASVRDQDIQGLEYVIVDGGSTDGTIDIIQANSDAIAISVIDTDRGISDAFNKGIALTSGKYIALLNADDWFSSGQLACGIETLDATGADFVFGNLLYHSADGTALHLVRGDDDYPRSISRRMPALNHPTVIVRRTAYERHGLFDHRWRLAMDYELLLRFHTAGARGAYDPRILGHMTLEGASDKNPAATLREVRDISIQYGYPLFLAQCLYFFRRVKGLARRKADLMLSANAGLALRHLFNKSLVNSK